MSGCAQGLAWDVVCDAGGAAAATDVPADALFSGQATLDPRLVVDRTRSHVLAREHQSD